MLPQNKTNARTRKVLPMTSDVLPTEELNIKSSKKGSFQMMLLLLQLFPFKARIKIDEKTSVDLAHTLQWGQPSHFTSIAI